MTNQKPGSAVEAKVLPHTDGEPWSVIVYNLTAEGSAVVMLFNTESLARRFAASFEMERLLRDCKRVLPDCILSEPSPLTYGDLDAVEEAIDTLLSTLDAEKDTP